MTRPHLSPHFPSLSTGSSASDPHLLSEPWMDRVGLWPGFPFGARLALGQWQTRPFCVPSCSHTFVRLPGGLLVQRSWRPAPTSRRERELQPKAAGLQAAGAVRTLFLQWERVAVLDLALELGLQVGMVAQHTEY